MNAFEVGVCILNQSQACSVINCLLLWAVRYGWHLLPHWQMSYNTITVPENPALQTLHHQSLFATSPQMERLAHRRRCSSGASCLNQVCTLQLINVALDISAIFEAREDVVTRHTRFTSKASVSALMAAVQQASTTLGAKSQKRSPTK